jgi:colanic acid biosynthesis glycosyl transferase WcaI
MANDGMRGRRVAILTSNFWPEQTGSSQTVSEFAEYLSTHGLSIRVATSLPYYPEWRVWPGYGGKIWRREQKSGMTIYRSWHYVRPSPSTLTRLVHEITLSLFAIPNIVRVLWRADVAYVISPALTFALTGSIIARVLGVRLVLVVKDVMPDAAIELGMLKNRLAIGLSSLMARFVYSLADEIHTLGDGMKRRIARLTKHVQKIKIVPDTIDAKELEPVPQESNEFLRDFGVAGSMLILHTGNMGKKQDLELILNTAQRLRDDQNIHFMVVGDGAEKPSFLRRRDSLGLRNVSHYPLQPRRLLKHMLSGADVVLVSQVAEVVDMIVPSKLITSLGAGAMVVAACAAESETAKIVRESNGGIVIPAGDDEQFARVILQLRRGERPIEQFRRNARAYAIDRFDRDRVYGQILNQIICLKAS